MTKSFLERERNRIQDAGYDTNPGHVRSGTMRFLVSQEEKSREEMISMLLITILPHDKLQLVNSRGCNTRLLREPATGNSNLHAAWEKYDVGKVKFAAGWLICRSEKRKGNLIMQVL